MNSQAQVLWERALKAFQTARQLAQDDVDAAGNRAYYAAFYAVSALFALDDKKYSKHSAVEAALHRELINTGRWERERGAEYSFWLTSGAKGISASSSTSPTKKWIRLLDVQETLLKRFASHQMNLMVETSNGIRNETHQT